jgi:repressor LexA
LIGNESVEKNTSNFNNLMNIKNLEPLPKMKKVPLLGTIACGEPILAEENIEDFINMPVQVKGTFALRCKGDSMINARIFDGDIVYIRQQPDVENGEIAAVLIDNEATLKRVYKYENRIELRPENPTFKVMNFENEELNNIRILGKAVGFFSKVI